MVVPVVGRRVPVIADARVEPEFGTGALKITPGHDPIDFEIGRDHGLEMLMVIGPDGRLIAEGSEGLDQRAADRQIVARLEERGPARGPGALPALRRHVRALSLPYRAARLAAVVVPDGRARAPLPSRSFVPRRVRFHPESQHRFAIESLEQRARLVVSRQLWWGTRSRSGRARTAPDVRLALAGGLRRVRVGRLERDPDVLDTWYSSALWPFATLGWPERNAELERYYPGDVNRPRARSFASGRTG